MAPLKKFLLKGNAIPSKFPKVPLEWNQAGVGRMDEKPQKRLSDSTNSLTNVSYIAQTTQFLGFEGCILSQSSKS